MASTTGHGEDVVEVLQGGDRLDHRDDGDPFVGIGRAAARAQPGDDRTPAAPAGRRVAPSGDGGGGLLGAVDHRHDDALGAGVEHLADDAGLVPRHPGDRPRSAGDDRLEHPDGVAVVERAVLQVDADVVETGAGGRLGGDDRRQREPRPECLAATRPAAGAASSWPPQLLGNHAAGTAGEHGEGVVDGVGVQPPAPDGSV